VVSGRNQQTVDQACGKLLEINENFPVIGKCCDVGVLANFSRSDIWINNAGVSLPSKLLWLYANDDLTGLIRMNIIGVINGSKVAIAGMLIQGNGHVYNMEGLGIVGALITRLELMVGFG